MWNPARGTNTPLTPNQGEPPLFPKWPHLTPLKNPSPPGQTPGGGVRSPLQETPPFRCEPRGGGRTPWGTQKEDPFCMGDPPPLTLNIPPLLRFKTPCGIPPPLPPP